MIPARLQKPLGDILAAPAEGVIVGHVTSARVLAEEVCEFESLPAIMRCVGRSGERSVRIG